LIESSMTTLPNSSPQNTQLVFCRPNFEAEAAAELADRAAQHGVSGYPETERGSGVVWFRALPDETGEGRKPGATFAHLIFARQCVEIFAQLRSLDPKDRLTPILAALPSTPARFGDVFVEHPDSDEGKPLAALARSFGNALRPALRKAGKLGAAPDPRLPRLHVVFLAGDHAALGSTDTRFAAPWPQGIPRLKLHRDAPSRSALKLEEALLTLLTEEERGNWVKPGMKAVDLGAAPGGWSWVLARQGVHVTAIDNGPLSETALATGLIRHQRADGFTWQPRDPVDWMVCDMVEQPRRVAARMAQWFANGWCRRAIFNLKLPMKKRYAEVQANLADFLRACADVGVTVRWRASQLYHDREEITVFAFVV
jgi:23S rRNA (cytidine2498-2'-O)-methyltransferase